MRRWTALVDDIDQEEYTSHRAAASTYRRVHMVRKGTALHSHNVSPGSGFRVRPASLMLWQERKTRDRRPNAAAHPVLPEGPPWPAPFTT